MTDCFLLVFIEANKHQKAMMAYEKALEWQELFTLAVSDRMSDAKLVETAYRVAGELSASIHVMLFSLLMRYISLIHVQLCRGPCVQKTVP